ncbi:MAG TPA: hypothetical protein VN640_03330 [Sphingomicrobium sp.]|nr:hypothetical protein [Sphingomicrobium sp.]
MALSELRWDAPADRSFRCVTIGGAVLAMLGAAAAKYGKSIPVFAADRATVEQAVLAWCPDGVTIDRAAGERYLGLFTNHYVWVDSGVGTILIGSSVALGALLLKLTGSGDEGPWLRTPRHRWHFLVLGLAVIAWTWWMTMFSLQIDLRRRVFPICADSIVIPMFELTVLTLILTPVLIVAGFALTRFFGPLPAALTVWDGSRPTRSWIVSVVFVALMAAVGAVLALCIPTSMTWASPALIVALYLIAATRAALLHRSDVTLPKIAASRARHG